MNKEELTWKEENRKKVFDCRVFSIFESYCRSPHNELSTFTILDAADWAIVVPVLEFWKRLKGKSLLWCGNGGMARRP